MNYLIINKNPNFTFFTSWYDYENNYTDGMIVVNMMNYTVSYNGKDFEEIEEDHL